MKRIGPQARRVQFKQLSTFLNGYSIRTMKKKTATDSTLFEAKIASPSDYSSIVRLCKRAVGPDDYVIPRLRHIISKRGLFLAIHNGELVGMSNLTFTLDRAGWFGMARTDPDWRRKGVAIFLQRAKAAYAKKRGIDKVRLFVLSTNTPSLKATLKGGFRPVSEAAHLSMTLSKSGPRERASRFRGKVKELTSSEYISKMNGYIGYNGTFVKAVDPKVFGKVKGEIYSMNNSIFVMNSLDRFEPGGHREFSLLQGHIEHALKDVASFARKLGTGSIGTFIPYERYLIGKARALGFVSDDWGWHSISLEKKI